MALVLRTMATATAGTQARYFEQKVLITVFIDVSSLDSTVVFAGAVLGRGSLWCLFADLEGDPDGHLHSRRLPVDGTGQEPPGPHGFF